MVSGLGGVVSQIMEDFMFAFAWVRGSGKNLDFDEGMLGGAFFEMDFESVG